MVLILLHQQCVCELRLQWLSRKQALMAFTNSSSFHWELVRLHLEPCKYITVMTVA